MSIYGRQSMTPGAGIQETSLAAVPTSLTSITGVDAWLFQMHINNPTAGALTFTATDGASNDGLTAVSVAAKQSLVVAWPFGLYMKGGFSVGASGSGLIYSACWRQ